MMQAGNRILVNYALIKIKSSAHTPFIVSIGFDKVSYTTVRSTAFESLVLNEQGNLVSGLTESGSNYVFEDNHCATRLTEVIDQSLLALLIAMMFKKEPMTEIQKDDLLVGFKSEHCTLEIVDARTAFEVVNSENEHE